ncbi:DMT family transporter [uncultured Allobaculum sp.]|nr:EamA family transporter [uncultured Allobaculum sp.]
MRQTVTESDEIAALSPSSSRRMASSKGAKGILYMVIASILFATGGLVLKWTNWNSLAINGVRSCFGAVVIGLFMLITHHRLRLNKSVFAGAVAYMFMTTLFVLSNKMTAAGNAIVLQFSCPIWIVLLNLILFHRKPDRRQIIALTLIVIGIVCFFLDSLQSGSWAGDLIAILSGLFYAILFMLNSFKNGDALSSIFLGQIGTVICMAPFAYGCSMTPSNLFAIFWLGTFQVGFAYVFFALGTGLISALNASLVNAIEPVLNPTLVALAGYESLSGLSLAGAAIVICSVIWNSLPASARRHLQAKTA